MKPLTSEKSSKTLAYAPIKTFRIQNFMGISDTTFEFDATNAMINLKGMNSVGKSAAIKAFRVLMTNYKQNMQKVFIRKGTKQFKLTLTLTNGVSVIYVKRDNGKHLYEIKNKDGKTLYSTRTGNTWAPFNDVPYEVQQVLGIITKNTDKVMTPHFLRTREPIFMVDTSGTKNAEYLKELFDPEELVKAQKLLNDDIKDKRQEQRDIKYTVAHLEETIENMPQITDAVLAHITQLDGSYEALDALTQQVHDSATSYSQWAAIQVMPKVPTVDHALINRVKAIREMQKRYADWQDITVIREIPLADTTDSHKAQQLLAVQTAIRTYQNSPRPLPQLPIIPTEAFAVAQALTQVKQVIADYGSLVDSLPQLPIIDLRLAKQLARIPRLPKVMPPLDHEIAKDKQLVEKAKQYQRVIEKLHELKQLDEELKEQEEKQRKLQVLLKKAQKVLNANGYMTMVCEDCGHLNIRKEGEQIA